MSETTSPGVRAPAGLPEGFPPVVYVPCVEHVADPAEARVEYKVTKDGRRALLVYSALDRLHAGAGQAQPWFLAPLAGLQGLYDLDGFDLVLMDVLVPDEHRRQAPAGQRSEEQGGRA